MDITHYASSSFVSLKHIPFLWSHSYKRSLASPRIECILELQFSISCFSGLVFRHLFFYVNQIYNDIPFLDYYYWSCLCLLLTLLFLLLHLFSSISYLRLAASEYTSRNQKNDQRLSSKIEDRDGRGNHLPCPVLKGLSLVYKSHMRFNLKGLSLVYKLVLGRQVLYLICSL